MHRGGDGVVREIELLADCRITILSERRRTSPYGLQGGGTGKQGRNLLLRDGEERELPAKCSIDARTGDRLVIKTPGGGGWGKEEGRS